MAWMAFVTSSQFQSCCDIWLFHNSQFQFILGSNISQTMSNSNVKPINLNLVKSHTISYYIFSSI